MQVSPSGMAAASQAAPGEFDSRHQLQKSTSFDKKLVDFYSSRKAWYVIAVGVCNHGLLCM